MATRGRPRQFDMEQALEQATEVFWAKGYEAATLADLQHAMGGITAPSFYAAFGSKEALFRKVMERHVAREGSRPARALTETPDTRAAIEALLATAIEIFCQNDRARGCMTLLALNCSSSGAAIQEHLLGLRRRRYKLIRQRLERGVREGDVPAHADIAALASFYTTLVDGLALQARDGASPKALKASVGCAMAAWDRMVGLPAPPRARA